MKKIMMVMFALSVAGCGKVGVSGVMSQITGSWAEVRLPPGCIVKQIAAESDSGTAILCEDGRVFH